MIVRVLITTGIVIVALLVILEIRGWLNGTRQMSKAQKVYRLSAGLVLETILVMILLGRTILAGLSPVTQITYWTAAMALTFMLIVIALLDVRATLLYYTERRRESFRDLISEERRKE
ncbi:MAG TPA: hypothetical protein PLU88_12655 [Armatimonadota bacterium]|nr:hypothetical protein [Armatimonadota bacterium]HOM71057.1 hypothetical protein [Armatimonadota bacterium]HOP81359.1 hypothetical protein [Armatimonadota bacterium]HPP75964.1 hypothetical protein [Armatimonadota bacterium]